MSFAGSSFSDKPSSLHTIDLRALEVMLEGPAAFPLTIRFKASLTSLREIGSSRLVKSSTWLMRLRTDGSR
eukprot:13035841-Ditylum_brightwellii.AAC.1